MDPQANIERQRKLAAEIIALEEDWVPGDDVDHDNLLASYAIELCELVVALDEWRRRGGYDPYAIGIVWTGE
jgi:hypothetical protein